MFKLAPGKKPSLLFSGHFMRLARHPDGGILTSTPGAICRLDSSGKLMPIADRWMGKRLSPNHIACRSDGSIYFSNMAPAVEPARRETESGVFRISPQGEVERVADIELPLGLAFSPDEKVLYVNNAGRQGPGDGRQTTIVRDQQGVRAFDIRPDGSLVNGRWLADMTTGGGAVVNSAETGVPDGLRVDADGRVYSAGAGGIAVFTPAGQRLGILQFPSPATNLGFGGSDGFWALVTCRPGLFGVRMRVRGAA